MLSAAQAPYSRQGLALSCRMCTQYLGTFKLRPAESLRGKSGRERGAMRMTIVCAWKTDKDIGILAPPKPPSLLRNFHLSPPNISSAPHHYGISHTLNERATRTPPINSTANPTENPSAARDTAPPTEATLHLHPAHNPLRRKLLHGTNDEPAACIQERKRHTKLATVESQFAEATECRGG